MSIQALSWVLEHSESSGYARCVMFSIANHADREGTNAYPSLETIARESKCSPATVKRMLVQLRDTLGELDWIRGIGASKTNYYWLPKMRLLLKVAARPEIAQVEPHQMAQKRPKSSSQSGKKWLNGELRTKSIQKQPKTGARAEDEMHTDDDGRSEPPEHIRAVLEKTKLKLRADRAKAATG